MTSRVPVLLAATLVLVTPAAAADYDPARPRRADEFRREVACLPSAAGPRCPARFVPTNSALDPTYVGSGYGLGRPSFFGARPPLGGQ